MAKVVPIGVSVAGADGLVPASEFTGGALPEEARARMVDADLRRRRTGLVWA
ncbi:hypothetical protein [Actinomadura litoris]|uniref:hypothetical protein n=1 Tax=Actinomadura litoris TaxID=2678616 RepID=UPI001FA73544|nr:hypothetical protein [Actinomadura litoris]